MNYFFLTGICLVLCIFSFGVKIHRDPGPVRNLFAYRTSSSCRNEDTWYTANLYAGRLLMISATIFLLILVLGQLVFAKPDVIAMLLGVYFLIALFLVFFRTEKHLRRNFFKDGKRRPGSF